MKLSETDKQNILNTGKFLIDKGYQVVVSDYGIQFHGQKNQVYAGFEPYSPRAMVTLRDLSRNRNYDMDWFGLVRGAKRKKNLNSVDHVLELLDFVQKEYGSLSDSNYLEETERLVNKMIDEME